MREEERRAFHNDWTLGLEETCSLSDQTDREFASVVVVSTQRTHSEIMSSSISKSESRSGDRIMGSPSSLAGKRGHGNETK